MTDVFNKEERSRVMRSVKSKRNKSTELKLIEHFKYNHIIGWRRNYKLLGNPDFVFPKLRVVIFTDGCFWHGHNCRNLIPKNNFEYWTNKINKNQARDNHNNELLSTLNWRVIRIWECELKNSKLIIEKLRQLY